MAHKLINQKHETYQKIEKVEKLMSELGLTLEVSKNTNNGLILTDSQKDVKVCFIDDNYEQSMEFPSTFENKKIICDVYGNPIEY